MKNFTYLILLLLLFTACEKGEVKPIAKAACADTTEHDIVSVNGPTKTLVDEETTFNISWKALNGCDSLVSLKEDTLENTFDIKAIASHDSCTVCVVNTPVYKSAAYKFKVARAGVYYLKFYKIDTSGNNNPIIDTLLVEKK